MLDAEQPRQFRLVTRTHNTPRQVCPRYDLGERGVDNAAPDETGG